MRRIILHWTVSGYAVNSDLLKHYHAVIDGQGRVHYGPLKPEANLDTSDGFYVEHTRGCNTGAIGIAVAAMRGAQERPFSKGDSPILPGQITALCELAADLCVTYGIEVTRQTVLTHAEVEPTLAIPQRGKWDITWLPGMKAPGNPIAVGDILRAQIKKAVRPAIAPKPDYVPTRPAKPKQLHEVVLGWFRR